MQNFSITVSSIEAFFQFFSLAEQDRGKAQLEDVINHGERILLQIPSESSLRAIVITTLAALFTRLPSQTFDAAKLISAIEYSQQALDLTPTSNPNRATWLNNLSLHLSTRYDREGKLEDLTRAIKYSQEAVDLTPADTPNRMRYLTVLTNLSLHLSKRYHREGKLEDLTRVLKYSQEAVDLTPAGKPDRIRYLTNLGEHLSKQYYREGKLEDLTQAIKYTQEAVNLIPASSPNQAGYLGHLSICLSKRYGREEKLEDLIQAIEYGIRATECLSSPLWMRINTCLITVGFLAQLKRWQEARAVLDRGLELLPFLISNLSSKLDQEAMIKWISGLAAIGCAVLLECSDDGYEAVRVLELSRGTINRLTTNSRAEISALRRFDPELAKQFEDLRSSINALNENLGKTTLSKEPVMLKLRDLLAQVRTNEGFEDFPNLLPKSELLENSSDQVSVLLNTTWVRTDALLIHSNKSIQILPLAKSLFQDSEDYYSSIGDRFGYSKTGNWKGSGDDMRLFLIWLWDQVVGPVLYAFGFEPLETPSVTISPEDQIKISRITQDSRADEPSILAPERLTAYRELMKQYPNFISSRSSRSSTGPSEARSRCSTSTIVRRLPRIHWIGVGLMSPFPFHAAGYGSQDPPKNTMSCAISSYASTLTAQAYAKQKLLKLEPSSSALLLVTMPKTPGLSDLPGVELEAKVIQDTLQGSMTVKLHNLQPVDVILKDLPSYSSVHFACHGYADPQSPFRSGVLLCGNEPEKSFDENVQNNTLTVEIVSSINTERAQLAFLSACCTAENASSVLKDEGIHLASAFQLAGYPHVIASLWEADDALSVAVAENFYQILFAESEIVGHDKVAYALHDAVRAAQQINDNPLAWATTIHFGP